VEDIWLTTADGNRVHAGWLPYPLARGAGLFCPGNAGNLLLAQARQLEQAAPEPKRCHLLPGSEPLLADCYEALAAFLGE